MYSDRLVIKNPGGLFGPVSIDALRRGQMTSSSRNARLMRILGYVTDPLDPSQTLCENRGSGIRSMLEALENNHMEPPEFRDELTTFTVVFPSHSLLDPDFWAWLETTGHKKLPRAQVLALARMRAGAIMKNKDYRELAGVDSRVATQDLDQLYELGLVERRGERASRRYFMTDGDTSEGASRANRRNVILQALRGRPPMLRAEIAEVTRLSDSIIRRWLPRLVADGDVDAIGSPNSPKRRYSIKDRR